MWYYNRLGHRFCHHDSDNMWYFQANKKDGYRDREEDKQTKSERDSDTKGET